MIVVDASVAVQWVVPEASTQLSEVLLSRPDLVAPELLLVEVANVFRKKLAGGLISAAQGVDGLEFVLQRVDVRPTTELVGRAFELALLLNHPVYDCVYLALAEANDAKFATHDLELRRRVVRSGRGDQLFDFAGATQ
ncbi:type II toxin-antitoxin system VapC family toxin [Devosia sp.]|uniref:type II toxin-antitoxin system VapC family toxin n=1 Tax=Devosia sp. TaxID=1871048 RepID=UPI0035B09F1A